MVEIKAEDVQAALDVLTVDGVFLREMTRHNAYDFAAAVADLVAVAREWLASQEQTPDIAISRDENGQWPEWVVNALAWAYYTDDCEPVAPAEYCPACGEDAIRSLDSLLEAQSDQVDAALVGFHPQPAEEEK